jgi:hypothetical protein
MNTPLFCITFIKLLNIDNSINPFKDNFNLLKFHHFYVSLSKICLPSIFRLQIIIIYQIKTSSNEYNPNEFL